MAAASILPAAQLRSRRLPARVQTRRQLGLAAAVYATLVGFNTAAVPQTLPTGGSVAAGSATISSPSAGTLNINQSSNRAVVNWQSFSVGSGGTVNFNQPGASSATLNRVTGSTPSSIAGTINAPGTVLLVNPNGIAITKSGVINTGSFAASTLDIKNEDFLAGKYKFTGNGSSATVTNAGRINVSDGGFAALLGGRVANDGVITARLGKVGLASGEMITLDMSGDGFVSVAVPSNQLGNLRDSTGKALVSNKGKIRADGGTVFLSAATASTLLRDAVNVPGSIRANSVGTSNGRIVIGGGAGGRVNVSGRLAAKGRAPGTTGGNIDISGAAITLASAKVDASGAAGGGKIRIGGDAQGSGDFHRAQSLSIDSASVIRADALDRGNGGTIVAWSDGLTSAKGTFSAKGGANGGDGGWIETSGHQLDFVGIQVNASSARGQAGTWLLDPTDLTVDATAAANISSTLNGGTNVTLQTFASGSPSGGFGFGSAGPGDININASITWTNPNTTLTLSAYHALNFNAEIFAGGKVALNTGFDPTYTTLALMNFNPGGTITFTSGIQAGMLTINGAAYRIMYSGFNIHQIQDNYAGNYAVGGDINMSNENFSLGDGVNGRIISGIVTGLGHRILNTRNAMFNLVGPTGIIRDFHIIGTSYGSGSAAAGLVNYSSGIIANSYVDGNMDGTGGGLVIAQTGGLITNSYFAGSISGGGYGLVNSMTGGAVLRNSYMAGSALGGALVGTAQNSTFSSVISYAMPLVASGSGNTFNNAYYDITANNGISSPYGTGLTTAQLQSALPTGFDPSIWGIVSGTSYPYMLAQFAKGATPQVVSGTAYTDAGVTPFSQGLIQLQIDGTTYSSDRTYAAKSGYYYFLAAPGSINVANVSVYTYVNFVGVSSYTVAANVSSSVSGLALWRGYLGTKTSVGNLSQTAADIAAATADITYNWGTFNLTGRLLIANGAFTINQSPSLVAASLGVITNSGDITVGVPVTLTTGNALSLNAAHNVVLNAAVTASGGTLVLYAGNDITGSAQGAISVGNSTFNAGHDITINATASFGNSTITAGHDFKSQAGATFVTSTITAGNDIAFGGSLGFTTLTLNAGHDVSFSGALNSTGTVILNAANAISAAQAVNVGGFTLQNGIWSQIGSLPNFSATDFRVTGGTFLRVLGGTGAAATPYRIADVYGLQGVASPGLLGKSFVLASDIDASLTTTWGANAGFAPIGNLASPFTGNFDGAGHAVKNLVINRGAQNYVGLFGASSGYIHDIGIVDGSIFGSTNVGGLIGGNLQGGLIERAYTSTTVRGATNVGGFVGLNIGEISQSYASTHVVGTSTGVGGFVGNNQHTATADGNIHDSYSSGDVSGAGQAGGFYGRTDSRIAITDAYSTGSVIGGGGGFGGFRDVNAAASVSVYWNTQTSGKSNAVQNGSTEPGSAGLTTADMVAGLPNGFDNNVWGIVADKSFPYLQWQFPGGTPQVVTGYAYKDAGVTLLGGASINAMVDGVTLGRGVTYANGLYIVLIPNGSILPTGSDVLAYYPANSAQGLVNSASFAYQATGSVTMTDIWGGYVSIPAAAGLMSAVNSAIAPAWAAVNAVSPTFATSLTAARLAGSGAFTIDQSPDLAGGNLLIGTTGSNDITVASIALSGNNKLILNAGRDIIFQGALSGSGNLMATAAHDINFGDIVSGTNNITLKAGNRIDAPFAISAKLFALTGGQFIQNSAVLPTFSATDFRITGGSFLRVAGGDGSAASPYRLIDIYGLQALAAPGLATQHFNWVLANNIDASTTATWNAGAGFIPIGFGDQEMRPSSAGGVVLGSGNHGAVDNVNSFQGTFDGQGNTINNITIIAARNDVGIFGSNNGTIKNVGVVGGTVIGNDFVGGLVGFNYGTITRSFTSQVTVSGRGAIGGFVGGNGSGGFISESYANSRVGGSYAAAGFVGANAGSTFWSDCCGFYRNSWEGTIINSYSMAAGGAGGFAGQGGGTAVIALEGGLANYAAIYGTTGLPNGFSSTVWGILPGYSYPYLLWQFPAGTTPQAITGRFYGDVNGNAVGGVQLASIVNGVSTGVTTWSDPSGYYQFLLPQGTVPTNAEVMVYTPTAGAGGGASIARTNSSVAGLDLYGSFLGWLTTGSVYSGINAELAQALGGNATAISYVTGLTGRYVTSTNVDAFQVDQALNLAGAFGVSANGISVTAAINAGGLVKLNALNNNDITATASISANGPVIIIGNDVTLAALSWANGPLALTATGAVKLNGVLNGSGANAGATITGASITDNAAFGWQNGLLTMTATGAIALNGTLTGVGPGAGASITGASVAANTINWQAANLTLRATNGDVNGGNLFGWGPGASLTLVGRNVSLSNGYWSNGGLNLQATAGNVFVAGSLIGSGAGASASITGQSVTILGGLVWSNGGLNLVASNGNVYVGAAAGGGTGAGGNISGSNIELGSLAWANGTMTTTTSGALTIYGNVDGMGSAWTLSAGTISVGGAVGVGTFNLNGGVWNQNTTGLPSFYAGAFNLAGGTQFSRFAGGDGSAVDPYVITDIYGLQGIVTTPALFSSNFKLGADIQAGTTAGWNGGAGFIPIGTVSQQFRGVFEGYNHNINGLTINRPGTDNVGLFGYVNSLFTRIQDFTLTNVNITGNNNVGGLVGSVGGAVRNITVTGNVTGLGNNVGGVAGSAFVGGGGNISGFRQVGFNGNVSAGTPSWVDLGNGTYTGSATGGTGGSNVGGLVGVTTVSVSKSYASGSVTSQGRYSANIGGLVGWLQSVSTNINENAAVTESLSTATVNAIGDAFTYHPAFSGAWFVGGLIGQNGNVGPVGSNYSLLVGGQRYVGGRVTSSVATGSVSGGGQPTGGLIGYNAGIITNSSATGTVTISSYDANFPTGSFSGVGGLVGYNVGSISQSFATGAVSNPTGGMTGGLVGQMGGGAISEFPLNMGAASVTDSYASGSVYGSGPTGGLFGVLQSLATFSRTYAMGAVSGGVKGGIAGWTFNSSANLDNYWNMETTGQVNAVGQVLGGNAGAYYYMFDDAARSPGSSIGNQKWATITIDGHQFQIPVAAYSYENFNFNSVWMTSAAGYPVLRNQTVLIVPNAASAAYGTGNPSVGYSAYGQLGYQSVNDVSIGINGTTTQGSGGWVSNGGNVNFVYLLGAVAITPQNITVQGGSISRTYGDANPTGTNSVNVTSGQLANGDTIGLVNISGGPGAANNTHNGGADADAGYSYGYTTSNAFFTSGSALNYNITYANGSIAVTPRQVSVQLTGSTQKVYDGNTSGAVLNASNFLLSNVYPGAPDYAALSASIAGVSAGIFGSANAGSGINVTATGVGLASTNAALALNYTLTSTTASGQIGTITPKALSGTVVISGINKTYDGTAAAGGGQITLAGGIDGLLAGASTIIRSVSGTYGSADAGSWTISGLTGLTSSNSNYSVGNLVVTGTGTISPKALSGTVVISGIDKVYDGTAAAGAGRIDLTGVNGLLAGATTTLSSLTGIYSGPDAGARTISGLTGLASSNGNYSVGNLIVTGAGTISPKALSGTVVISGIDKTYDGTTAAGGGQIILTGIDGLLAGASTTIKSLTGTYDSANAGNRTVSGLTGLTSSNGNYSVGALVVTGIGEIAARQITVTAAGQSKIYGNVDPTLSYGIGGLGLAVGDTQASVFTGSQTRAIGETVVGGPYGITQGSLLANSNYSIVSYTGALLTITPRQISVTADAQTKIYGNVDPTLSYGVGGLGLATGDTQASVFTGSQTRVAGETVTGGPYNITQGSLLANSNYSITQYTGARLAITAREITVTADAQTKVYGNVDPTLSYGVGGLGLATGDTQASVFTGSQTRVAGETVTGGPYNITQGLLLANSNYSITQYTGSQLAITQREITVTADAQTKVYGNVDPTLSFVVGGSNLANGDTLATAFTGTQTRAAGETVTGGPYAITQGSLLASSNYSITQYTGAQLAITPRRITVTADAQTKIYGDVDPALTYVVGGSNLANGDTLATAFTGLQTRAAGETVAGGPYGITQGMLLASSNYLITQYTGAALTITPRSVTVTARGGNSVYGASPLDPGLSAVGLQFGEDISTLTGLSNSFGITRFTNAGSHTLSVAGALTNTNYSVQSTVDGSWTVNRASLTVTADNASKTLGQTVTFAGTEFTSVGLQNGETIGSTTLSSLGQPATADLVGSPYTIKISNAVGGSFNLANYQVTYVPGLLTVKPPPPIFQPLPAVPGAPTNNTGISFQAPAATPVSFTTGNAGAGGTRTAATTPNTTVAAVTPTDQADPTATGSLGDSGASLATNNGLTFLPISQYDPAQYSGGQLPGYQNRDGEAAIFTMLGRAIATDKTVALYIDGFWNAEAADKQGASDPKPLQPKVTFSDGAGKDVAPDGSNAFKIVAGTTDLGQLLAKGPLMIQGAVPQDGSVAPWLLAIRLTDDGKGIIANDPVTGRQVTLGYDPDTKTAGAITAIFNPATKAWTPVAEAGSVQVAGDASAVPDVAAALQGFVPATFFAVTFN